MIETQTKEELREHLKDWRRAGDHIAIVPTMGNLHDGHLKLVEIAREHAERVVVTIFVNPTQFGDGEDFEDYPRTMERDRRRLKRARADLLFSPTVEVIYPFGVDTAASVTVPVLTDDFCGESRPGHFDGVTGVVSRLFSLVQPDVAVFGQKDYQQLLVIKRLVDDMSIPLEIVAAPTEREDDGLAMSSRNQYLTEDERAVAPELFRALSTVARALEAGDENFTELEAQAIATLEKAGFEPEYVSIRRAENLEPPVRASDELVVMAAAQLGAARLIDNVLVHV
ncbi:MAG: pantoate--beta-alanine ligase [Pseudomonadota bacterium]